MMHLFGWGVNNPPCRLKTKMMSFRGDAFLLVFGVWCISVHWCLLQCFCCALGFPEGLRFYVGLRSWSKGVFFLRGFTSESVLQDSFR